MAAKLLKKVNDILGENLSDYESGLDYIKETRRVMGFVISSDFKGPDHAKRQRRLEKVLKKKLTDEELYHVGPIVTMNPDEARLHDAA